MQPAKNWSQYVFFSLSVLARGFMDWFVRMHAATAASHISFLHASPTGEAWVVIEEDEANQQQNVTAGMIVLVKLWNLIMNVSDRVRVCGRSFVVVTMDVRWSLVSGRREDRTSSSREWA
jgi:hypothetical protein